MGLNLVSGIGLLQVLATACWCGFLFICCTGFEVGSDNYCLGLVTWWLCLLLVICGV